MDYGKAINNLRVNRMKMQQGAFAECIGVTRNHLCDIELGKRKPSLRLLEKIAAFVDIPLGLMFWSSLTEDDVPQEKLEVYRVFKKPIDEIIQRLM